MAPVTASADRIAEAVRLYADGATTREVAALLGVRDTTVGRWVGDAARPRGRRKRDDVTDADVIAMREEDELSWNEMAATLRMSRTGVRMRYAQASGQGRPGR